VNAASALGEIQARLQHAAALEMIWRQRRGRIEAARARRAIIKLPKYTRSVEGTLALQLLGGESSQRDEVSRLLAREYVIWQITRAREKADALSRLVREGRATSALVSARATEVQALAEIPAASRAATSTLSASPPSRAFITCCGRRSAVGGSSLRPALSSRFDGWLRRRPQCRR
jgi:hypothetical protein